MVALPAHLVAAPVLERLTGARAGVVLGAGATAAWVEVDGFVVAVTTREVPLLPNAVALAATSGALTRPGVAPGAPARLAPGRVDLGPLRVTWDPAAPPAWDPTVPVPRALDREALARRAATLRTALVGAVDSPEHPRGGSATLPLRGPREPGVGFWRAPGSERAAPRPSGGFGDAPDPDPAALVGELARGGLATANDPGGASAMIRLFRAIAGRDPEAAGRAARELLGRGPGLTPEGDDLLAAVAGTLAVVGPTTGPQGPATGTEGPATGTLAVVGPATGPQGPATGTERPTLDEPLGEPLDGATLATLAAFLGALGPVPGRTTALSATLLGLAARRRLAEPAGRLLDFGQGAEAALPAAMARLERLGHGSGRAYAAGIAATASLLAAAAPVR
jgi:hypothetical protein